MISMFIAKVFLVVFETAIDTILQCYLMDMEMAASSRPLYCSTSLKEVIDENRRINIENGEYDMPVFME